MNHPSILDQTILAEITGYTQGADIARCLRGQGVKVFNGKQGRIWTTIELINSAGGIKSDGAANDEEGFDPI